MPKWEYLTLRWDSETVGEMEQELDTEGREGWELVSVVCRGIQIIAFLKRRSD